MEMAGCWKRSSDILRVRGPCSLPRLKFILLQMLCLSLKFNKIKEFLDQFSNRQLFEEGPLTFWHWSFTFNSNESPTWCSNFSVYYPDVCLQLNMFRAFCRPSSGAQWLQWQTLVLPSYRGDSRAVFVVRPAGRPDHEHSKEFQSQTVLIALEDIIEQHMARKPSKQQLI